MKTFMARENLDESRNLGRWCNPCRYGGSVALGFALGCSRRALGLIATLIFFSIEAQAGNTYPVPTDASSGVKIELKTWFADAPPSGVIPVRVRISNLTDQDLVYELQSQDQAYGFGTYIAKAQAGAAAGATVETELYLPLEGNPNDAGKSSYYKNVNLTMNGPALKSSHIATISQSHSGSSGSSSSTGFIGMDSALPFTSINSLVSGAEMLGESLKMSEAPRDWRGYTSLAQLWVSDTNLAAMSSEQRAAMLDWVATGGRLFVRTDKPESVAGTLQLKPITEAKRVHGFGSIQTLNESLTATVTTSKSTSSPFASAAAELIGKPKDQDLYSQLRCYLASSWKLRKMAGELVLNGKLIFGFILVFGIIVGPVNLFVLAPAARRQRLFWTTPLISLLGSAMLLALMLLQDGIGGTGSRLTLGILEPQTKRLSVFQEQASRTGILLSRSFAKTESAWLLPLPNESGSGPGLHISGGDMECTETPTTYEGKWFSSRATQAQAVIAVRPSREAVELTPGASPNDAPSIVSSIGNGLKTLYVMDDAKQLWKAENVGTGERVTLKKATQDDFKKWQNTTISQSCSKLFDIRTESITHQDGHWFLAEVEQPEKLAVPTLASIRWTNDHAFIGGPWTKK